MLRVGRGLKGRSKKAKGRSKSGAAPLTFAFCLLTSYFQWLRVAGLGAPSSAQAELRPTGPHAALNFPPNNFSRSRVLNLQMHSAAILVDSAFSNTPGMSLTSQGYCTRLSNSSRGGASMMSEENRIKSTAYAEQIRGAKFEPAEERLSSKQLFRIAAELQEFLTKRRSRRRRNAASANLTRYYVE